MPIRAGSVMPSGLSGELHGALAGTADTGMGPSSSSRIQAAQARELSISEYPPAVAIVCEGNELSRDQPKWAGLASPVVGDELSDDFLPGLECRSVPGRVPLTGSWSDEGILDAASDDVARMPRRWQRVQRNMLPCDVSRIVRRARARVGMRDPPGTYPFRIDVARTEGIDDELARGNCPVELEHREFARIVELEDDVRVIERKPEWNPSGGNLAPHTANPTKVLGPHVDVHLEGR